MNRQETKTRLKFLYHELENIKFPNFSGNEELDHLIDELADLDFYYAGMV